MVKVCLNNYSMNDAIDMLKRFSMKKERTNFIVKCDNCTLDIVCGGLFKRDDNKVEVALFTRNGNAWHPLPFVNEDGSLFAVDRPIINISLMCFPAFVSQFKALSDRDMSIVWDAWDTISDFPM